MVTTDNKIPNKKQRPFILRKCFFINKIEDNIISKQIKQLYDCELS